MHKESAQTLTSNWVALPVLMILGYGRYLESINTATAKTATS